MELGEFEAMRGVPWEPVPGREDTEIRTEVSIPEERIRLEQENSAESGGHGLKRLNTSWQRSLTRSQTKANDKVRASSKSSMVKKSADSSDQSSRELSNVVQEHRK